MTGEVLVVVGATGGVGASTLAALLARHRVQQGKRVALVDLDHGRGGIEVLLGCEAQPGARWADLMDVRGSVAAADLDGLLPRWEGVEVLGGDRRGGQPGPGSVEALWTALVVACDTVVVELAARTVADSPARTVLEGRSDLLLLTGQDVLGVAGALAVRTGVGRGPAQLVLRRRRAARVAPLEAAHLLDLPLLALLPGERRLGEAVDRGLGPQPVPRGRLARAVERVAAGAGRG